ncbi:MAG: protease inhibitor I42 family protein [Methanomicrobiales archaeon]|nr:protease inhibitor I42 family protein [Methanomicrobiales archaeon]
MSMRTFLTPLLAFAFISAVFLAGCTGPAVQPLPTPAPTPSPTGAPMPAGPNSFTQVNDGGTYPVSLDSEIQLRLPENPTTGFSWNLSVTTGLSVMNDSYIPDDTSGKLVGSGGIHAWFLKAVQPGEQVISGVYRRPWEPAAPGVTFFKLSLVVGEDACGGNVCTLPITTPAAPPRFHVYADADNGKTVQELLGETFNIRLQENPTTGYSWNMSVSEGLRISRDEYIPSSSNGQMVGTGGIRSFTLLAMSKGEQMITAEYRRPWVTSGTVTYQNIEGGFFGILGDDGKKYEPLNLDGKYQKDGLRVAFEATIVKDAVSTRMWGTPVNLAQIEVIPEFTLTVMVE